MKPLLDPLLKNEENNIFYDPNTVIVSGYYINNGKETACYWVNNSRMDLDFDELIPERSWATGIAKLGDQIYIAGYAEALDPASDLPYYFACYWEDGILFNEGFDYADNTSRVEVTGIAADPNNVYIIGYCVNTSGDRLGGYWVNGRWEELGANITPIAIAVNGEGADIEVHIIVSHLTSNHFDYFKNGSDVGVFLSPDYQHREFSDITVSNGKVYITGSYVVEGVGQTAFYHMVDGETIYNFGLFGANAIAVSNGNVYIAGYSHDYKPKFYVSGGGGIKNLSVPPASSTDISGIDVLNGTVYVSGNLSMSDDSNRACYWRNGVRTGLSPGSNAKATGIVVIRQE